MVFSFFFIWNLVYEILSGMTRPSTVLCRKTFTCIKTAFLVSLLSLTHNYPKNLQRRSRKKGEVAKQNNVRYTVKVKQSYHLTH